MLCAARVKPNLGHSTMLKVFNMDVFYDDTALRALSVNERTQLLPEDVTCIASVDSAQK